RFLRSRSEIDAQLVIPASMKPADAASVVDAYAMFQPQRLIFTRVDETNSHGLILNEAARTGRPISFLSKAQRIPEDLDEAAPNPPPRPCAAGPPPDARCAARAAHPPARSGLGTRRHVFVSS